LAVACLSNPSFSMALTISNALRFSPRFRQVSYHAAHQAFLLIEISGRFPVLVSVPSFVLV
jgi:hypothetical protein